MLEQGWIQHRMKMEYKLEKKHWEQCKIDNTNLILQSMMTIDMAERVLVMVEDKLTEFPKESVKPATPAK